MFAKDNCFGNPFAANSPLKIQSTFKLYILSINLYHPDEI